MKRKLNVRLLRRIQRHILEEPRRFFMHWYFERKTTSETYYGDNHSSVKFPPCGTAACIAGWANILSGESHAANPEHAITLLGLEMKSIDAHENGVHFLFDVGGWPKAFRSKYKRLKTPASRAKVAADRIEHLIQTGE